jgi:SAM-dependent methyltransferase
VRALLPAPPGVVVELGCGRHGGFVPSLNHAGYQALGVDPVAPEGASYRRAEFEHAELPDELDAVVACTSLHHVADPGRVLDTIARHLVAGGVVVVIEWDWERFGEATARWCFERLGPDCPHSWLHHRREDWIASGEEWEHYLRGWTERHGIHSASALLEKLDSRFERVHFARGAYFFGDLADTSEEEELLAIGSGQIQSTRIDYCGVLTEG